jgi:hypothetical protein
MKTANTICVRVKRTKANKVTVRAQFNRLLLMARNPFRSVSNDLKPIETKARFSALPGKPIATSLNR